MDGMALLVEKAREPGAVRARALDAEGVDNAQRPGPGFEFAVAARADLDRQFSDTGAEPRDGHGGMGVLMGVDADDDVGGASLMSPVLRRCAVPAIRRADRTVTGWTASGSYEVTSR